jgi:hypothetical protein
MPAKGGVREGWVGGRQVELESAEERVVERDGGEDRKDVREEDSRGREVRELLHCTTEGNGEFVELFAGVGVGHDGW